MSTDQLGGGNMQMNTSLFMNVLQQCCNEDWKWTKDEYEESSLIKKFFEDLWRLQILQISSKIRRFSKENEKFLLLKIFFQAAT